MILLDSTDNKHKTTLLEFFEQNNLREEYGGNITVDNEYAKLMQHSSILEYL